MKLGQDPDKAGDAGLDADHAEVANELRYSSLWERTRTMLCQKVKVAAAKLRYLEKTLQLPVSVKDL